MIDKDKLRKISELIDHADLVTLHFGDKKAALGRDIQIVIVSALKIVVALVEEAE